MESCKSANQQVSYMRQMLDNKIMLLTVVLAIGAAIYFCVGLFVLLGH